jgi:serine/threonine protein phosphatase PrpC
LPAATDSFDAMLQLRSHPGCVRESNDDWVAARRLRDLAVAAVLCDGVSGFKHGREAARCAATAFLDRVLEGLEEDRDPPSARRLGLDLRRSIARLQQQRGERRIATTLTGLLLLGHRAWIYHIGDSRAYRLHGDGLQRLSEDHGLTHTGGQVLGRALGHPEREDLDQRVIKLEAGDRLLLCSDGLFDAGLDEADIAGICARGAAAACADRLLETALAGGAPDNVSLLLLDTGAWR